MKAGCTVTATSKNSISIACAQHATHDMKPFNPSIRKRKQVREESDNEVYSFIFACNFNMLCEECFGFFNVAICIHVQIILQIPFVQNFHVICSCPN